MDDDFQKAFKDFLKKKEIKRIDPASPDGGIKLLASPEYEGEREFMLRRIKRSSELHSAKTVFLFAHHDCMAYGGFERFDNDPEKEFEFQQNELRKAREVIRESYPDMGIEMYFIDCHGVIPVE